MKNRKKFDPAASQLENCQNCKGKCCDYVAIEIENPTCKSDYDNIRWYLMHENIHVFIDHDGDWTLEFFTKCRNHKKDFSCAKYRQRPRICRKYPGKDQLCEFEGNDLPHAELFTHSNEFERYLERKKIDWKWKKQ